MRRQTIGFIQVQSMLDVNNTITKDNWVVALCRKGDNKALNPEYAFLLLEGVEKDGQIIIAKYEFGISSQGSSFINIIENKGTPSEMQQQLNNLIWSIKIKGEEVTLKNLSNKWYKRSWSITQEQAKQLIKNIEQDKLNSSSSSAIGKTSLFKNGSGSPNIELNGYVWAKQKLLDLNDYRINTVADVDNNWMDRLVTVVSKHIGKIRDITV